MCVRACLRACVCVCVHVCVCVQAGGRKLKGARARAEGVRGEVQSPTVTGIRQ